MNVQGSRPGIRGESRSRAHARLVGTYSAALHLIRCLRAPRWAPLWLRRALPGCWTQAEIEDIWVRADEQWAEMLQWIEGGGETCFYCDAVGDHHRSTCPRRRS